MIENSAVAERRNLMSICYRLLCVSAKIINPLFLIPKSDNFLLQRRTCQNSIPVRFILISRTQEWLAILFHLKTDPLLI